MCADGGPVWTPSGHGQEPQDADSSPQRPLLSTSPEERFSKRCSLVQTELRGRGLRVMGIKGLEYLKNPFYLLTQAWRFL